MPVETTAFADRFSEWTPLAQGAEGRLYRVRDRWTQRLGALKVGSGDSARDALVGEFRLLSFLRHPCLIRSEDLLVEADTWAHLLQYVPAVEPARLWDAGGEDAVRAALTQALRALTYLHRRGFVHGDVAPGNVLVWRDGDRWRAKLADLGLTLPLDRAAAAGIRGTPGYWAPESARGEGLTPASDLYALAVTAFAWIEGQGPWDGLGSAEMLRTLAAGPPVPRPRRRISPELESLLATLGSPHPERRSRWDWAELRRYEALWGPPTVIATVAGVEPYLQEWETWAKDLPEGGVGSLVLRGRIGTGRTTAMRCLGRSLAARGWAGLWQPPRWWGSEGDPKAAESQDPVLLSRELVRVLADRDAVLVWPTHATDAQLRVLRGFLAAREDARSQVRTAVLKVASIEAEDGEADWLLGATRCRTENWTPPTVEAIDSMRADLFPPEEGLAPDPGFRSDSTPLALVLHKQAFISGAAGEGAGGEALGQELARLWERASHPAREALAVLAWSDRGWAAQDLASVLGWEGKTEGAVWAELDRLRLTRRRFEQDTAVESLTDEMTRGVLEQRAQEVLSPLVLTRLAHSLEDGSHHGGDLRLARRLVGAGQEALGFLVRSLEAALSEGRYEEILELAREVHSGDTASLDGVSYSREVDRKCLLAAQRAGKYEDEVRILRRLIDGSPVESVLEEQKMLAQALASLGDWQGALDVCRRIEEDPKLSASPRIWAGLQRAETLWQAGRFAEADAAYESVYPALTGGMQDEWLRFAVGRARQHGQRGDMSGVKRYLEMAEQQVGKERCEQDPMYLNTVAGALIEEARLLQARPILDRARQIAQHHGEWNAYIMVASREANITYDLGLMFEAGNLGRDCVSTAEVLNSQRMMGFTNTFQGYVETHQGAIGAAYRRAQRVLELSSVLSDLTLELLGQRLRLFIASNMGWLEILESSVIRARSIAQKIDEKGTLAFISHYEGLLRLGRGDLEEGAVHLRNACAAYSESGQKGSEIRSRFFLNWCLYLQHRDSAHAQEMKELIKSIESQVSASLQPLALLAMFELDSDYRREHGGQAFTTLLDLWANGRVLDVIEWGAPVMQHMEGHQRSNLKSIMVNAVQRVANSLDDVQLRRDFLAFPKTRRALQAIQQ